MIYLGSTDGRASRAAGTEYDFLFVRPEFKVEHSVKRQLLLLRPATRPEVDEEAGLEADVCAR